MLKTRPAKILMLAASLSVTGTHRILLDLLKGLNRSKFEALVAYKPDFPGPGNDLVSEIATLGFKILPLSALHRFSLVYVTLIGSSGPSANLMQEGFLNNIEIDRMS